MRGASRWSTLRRRALQLGGCVARTSAAPGAGCQETRFHVAVDDALTALVFTFPPIGATHA